MQVSLSFRNRFSLVKAIHTDFLYTCVLTQAHKYIDIGYIPVATLFFKMYLLEVPVNLNSAFSFLPVILQKKAGKFLIVYFVSMEWEQIFSWSYKVSQLAQLKALSRDILVKELDSWIFEF